MIEAAKLPRRAAGARLGRALTMALLFAAVGGVMASSIPVCPTAGLLGVPCPGCGLTRASVALLGGDLAGALHLHPLVLVAAPGFALFALEAAWSYVQGPARPARSARLDRAVSVFALVCVVLLIAVWAARFFGAFGGPVPVVRWW